VDNRLPQTLSRGSPVIVSRLNRECISIVDVELSLLQAMIDLEFRLARTLFVRSSRPISN
jgi:hypothetical protein